MPEVENRKGRGQQSQKAKDLSTNAERGSWWTAKLRRARLKGDGQAVELEVDEVAAGVTGLAACGDVGAASLLDGNGDCEDDCQFEMPLIGREEMTNGWGWRGSWRQ